MQPSPHSGRRGVHHVAAAAVLLLVTGTVLAVLGLRPATTPTPGQSAAATTTQPSKTAGPGSGSESARPRADKRGKAANPPRSMDRPDFGQVLPGSAPVAVTIPRIGVQANEFVGLGLADNGEIEVPRNPDTPGWFTPGPTPGQLGPSVIAGHVDGTTGPAVFYRLSELQPGDRVKIDRQDGSVAHFTIDRVVSYNKAAFPTRAVYGPTTRAELRLITCGGPYDNETGYLRNTVVFAHLV